MTASRGRDGSGGEVKAGAAGAVQFSSEVENRITNVVLYFGENLHYLSGQILAVIRWILSQSIHVSQLAIQREISNQHHIRRIWLTR